MAESPGEWRTVKIADLADVFDGPHATPRTADQGPYFLGISSLVEGRLDLSKSGRLSEEDYLKWTRRVTPREGDVVFSYETRLGEAALIPANLRCCLGRRLALMRPDPQVVDSRFLLYAYLGPAFQETLRARTVPGSTVDRLLLRDFPSFPIRVPDLPAQRAIAEALGALDDKIESNRRRATCAEELLDVLALTVPSTDQVGVGLLAEVDRLSVDPSGSSVVDHFSLPAFDGSRLPERVAGTSIRSSKLAVQEPSVLVSRLNPETNRTWYAVPDPAVPAMASTEWLVLRPVKGLSLGGLWLAVRDVHFRGELARRATGTSGSHQRIRPADALSIEVPDPRGGDAAVLEEADALLDLVHQARVESETLATLRDTLLPELLSGRLRVPEAEDLVADAV